MSNQLDLIGVNFEALKDCCQHYSGDAVVVARKKNGMYLCKGVDGTRFEENQAKIKRGISNE